MQAGAGWACKDLARPACRSLRQRRRARRSLSGAVKRQSAVAAQRPKDAQSAEGVRREAHRCLLAASRKPTNSPVGLAARRRGRRGGHQRAKAAGGAGQGREWGPGRGVCRRGARRCVLLQRCRGGGPGRGLAAGAWVRCSDHTPRSQHCFPSQASQAARMGAGIPEPVADQSPASGVCAAQHACKQSGRQASFVRPGGSCALTHGRRLHLPVAPQRSKQQGSAGPPQARAAPHSAAPRARMLPPRPGPRAAAQRAARGAGMCSWRRAARCT